MHSRHTQVLLASTPTCFRILYGRTNAPSLYCLLLDPYQIQAYHRCIQYLDTIHQFYNYYKLYVQHLLTVRPEHEAMRKRNTIVVTGVLYF